VAVLRAGATPDTVAALHAGAAPRLVRLLPPSDPYLQGRDRSLLVPDPARAAAVWSGLAKPGAVLVDGEIAGTWRARLAGKRLDIAVTPFDRLDAGQRSAVDSEAARIAAVRSAADVRVSVSA